ncbi:uncharacterized protein LOC141909092 [Tubulanus polymorphus]|uniref:uncharacterized protein LOC141909092 n=1 Tax=Tubulanus polymorphus TaxID=672921 RepID=UPI003DA3DB6F
MAFLAYKEVDGILINDTTTSDAVDGVPEQVLHVSHDVDIPARYYTQTLFSSTPATAENQRQNSRRLSEKSARYRMVHVDWGKDFGQLDYTKNMLALLQVQNNPITEEKTNSIQQFLKNHLCCLVRWDSKHLLVQLPDDDASQALGQAFLDERLDDIDGYKVERIDPSVLTNPPKVLFEIDTNQSDKVCQCLSEVIAPFAARFTYIVVRQVDSIMPDQDLIPALIVSLLFHGRSQGNAERAVQHLNESPWLKVSLPSGIASELDFPLVLYRNGRFNVPMIGIQTGCVQSGIQLTLLVQDSQNFQSMESFYCKVTGLVPLRRSSHESAMRYCTFPLSSRAELVIAFYPEFAAKSLRNAAIYIQVSEVNHIDSLIRLSEDHWHTNDPEGNRVVLYMPLK